MENEQDIKEQSFAKTLEITSISEEMRRAYLDYAMSVIVARALPDIKDGLKPGQRRILYAMHTLGLNHKAKFRKSALVVGEVLGKYHPHGDSAVYDTLVRLAQDWSLRYPLIQGQGNFGSIDNDPPAAMRYTEARLAHIADSVLQDIDKETVQFIPNFDATRTEPVRLPSILPNLLLNGADGIAVGMATKIPPHHLGEIVDALIFMIERVEIAKDKQNQPLLFQYPITVEDLVAIVKGPDFPTGGIVYNQHDIVQMYATGRGRVVLRAQAKIEEKKDGRFAIIVSEIPYQVNKALLIEKIAFLVKEKKIEGISDVRDESDRDGLRMVIELKKEAQPRRVLNQLYKDTPMQIAYNANMVALLDGEPRLFPLKLMLESFLLHRFDVVTARTKFELTRAKERAHILEGLKIALDHLDAVIKTIRESADADVAKTNLIKRFKLSDIQAQAILDMQLRKLAALERKKIEEEYKEILKTIQGLEAILKNPKRVFKIVHDELSFLKEKYGDERRTKVVKSQVGEFSDEDLVKKEEVILSLTKANYIKRIPFDTYKTQHRGGKGVIGMTTRDGDHVISVQTANTHDTILLFTSKGRVFELKVFEIPEASRTAKGQPVVNLISCDQDERVSAILPLKNGDHGRDYDSLLMVTRSGTIKKTLMEDYENIRRSGLIAIKLAQGDELTHVHPIKASDQALLITHLGQSIRFKVSDIRETGRATQGVIGIRIKNTEDYVISSEIVRPESQILMVTENGYGKRTREQAHHVQNRGGQGVKAAKITQKTGKIISTVMVDDLKTELVLISVKGILIKVPIKNIPVLSRTTQGVKVMRLGSGDKVAGMAYLSEKAIESMSEQKPE